MFGLNHPCPQHKLILNRPCPQHGHGAVFILTAQATTRIAKHGSPALSGATRPLLPERSNPFG
jgi:hypothetical protein